MPDEPQDATLTGLFMDVSVEAILYRPMNYRTIYLFCD